jgi:glutamyl-tRNA synthetase
METTSPLTDAERAELANLLFPDASRLPPLETLEQRYPARNLPAGAMVTRVAPSPTGFAHIGFVYMSLINRRFAHQTGGRFLLRIEDTDSKREVSGAFETIINTLASFGLDPDEGFVRGKSLQFEEIGDYGPYLQSTRRDIYRSMTHHLIRTGFAYPCFSTEEELTKANELQTLQKVRPGYYGKWAVWRDAPLPKIKAALDEGKPFVVRLRSFGDPTKRTTWSDGVKGEMSMPESDLDIVVLKSDGQSLYHLAHAIDDHFMRITHVIRGDEWVSSVPTHIQIFKAFGWHHPHYSHLSTIQKLEMVREIDEESGKEVERQSKRKLSKRKDPEANAAFYAEMGFPPGAVIEYLLNIANSDFEDWRRANPDTAEADFKIKLEKLSPAGALADTVKLTSISKEVIGRMAIEQLHTEALAWAKRYDEPLAHLMELDPDYTRRCLNIERGGKKPSKRISTWRDLRPQIAWLFDPVFGEITSFEYPESISADDRKAIVSEFLKSYNPSDDRDTWFAKCKDAAKVLGFAAEMKEFKAAPQNFKGSIGDLTMVLRVAIAGSRQSPDLHETMQVLGIERLKKRLGAA